MERIEQTNTQKLEIFGATKSKKEPDFVGIEKEAKQILDKFAKALEKVEQEHNLDFYVDREEFERTEQNGREGDKGFKQKILENAPNKDEDFIIAEKGGWK